ncbi:MAG: TetR/AcrR family transcriptional regulator [Flavobacteriales bacterium]|nr:TetR/AcrR family transcriptional regulator [Flavobacteriales bacterium]
MPQTANAQKIPKDKMEVTAMGATQVISARALNKQRNRQKLLNAAAQAVYKYGFKATTIDRIQEISGLSRGMVNQYYGNMEGLLWAVAEQLMQNYLRNWKSAIEHPGLSTADKIKAMFEADLSKRVLNPQCVAIWFSFRAEVPKTYNFRAVIDKGDQETHQKFKSLCTELRKEGGYLESSSNLAALTFTALLEGFWTDFHLHPDTFSPDRAKQALLHSAKSFFPNHF